MSAIREQAVLDAPVSAVWELVSDLRRYPEWFPRVFEMSRNVPPCASVSCQWTKNPLTVGSWTPWRA